MTHESWLRKIIPYTLNWILLISLLDSSFILSASDVLSQDHVVRRIQRSMRDLSSSEALNRQTRDAHSSQPSIGVEYAEIAHVSFVTELRHRRDLSQNEYHIIKLYRKVANTTMEIHLVKRAAITSSDFKVVIKNGDQIEDEEELASSNSTQKDCLYDGIISSEPEGKVAFSVCGKEPGFSGIIVTNDGNWIIEPQKDSGKDYNDPEDETQDNSMINGPGIPHLIVKVHPPSHDRHKSLMSDELHVPANELEKAAELARIEAEERTDRNETGDDNPDHISRVDANGADELDENDEDQEVLLLFPNSESNDMNPKVVTGPGKRKNRRTNKRASPTTTTSRSGRSNGIKTSASSSTNTSKKITVEIAVFTDDDFYDQMKVRYPKDTMRKIKDYVLTMIHSMDLLYQHESLGTDLHFKLVHLEIQKKRPSRLNSHGGKAKSYLTSFCDYAGDLNINNNIWDHALMLTGHDLIEEGTSSTAGLAWAGTMCYRYYSCSISEGTQFGSVFIITHEIGHSMGMEHDGMGVSSTCDEDKYLMSPTTGPGKVTWSTCSGQNLKDFLKYGTSELRGGKSAVKPVCMTESARESKNIQYTSSTLPGQKYDSTKQCALSMGKKYTPVMRKDSPFNNICSMLYCGNGTHAISTHPALDGTQCSNGKQCQGGQCK